MSADISTNAAAAPAGGPGRASGRRVLLNDHRIRLAELLPWAIAIAVFFLFPGYRLLATQILIMILFALSLDLIVGYAGIVSLGHSAFFGTGAYTAALLVSSYGVGEPVTGLVAAIVVSALLGFVTGWVLLRTHGLTLLMLTMAFAIMLHELANEFAEITGGFDGINFAPGPILGIFDFDPLWFSTNYFYALAFLFLGFLFIRAIVYSPFGRALVGIRENGRRMHAIGSPVLWRMVTAYTIAAGIAGLAGAIYVQVQGNVTLGVLSFELSGDILVMLILGGTGRLYGAFIGAAVYKLLESFTEQILGTDQPYWMLVIGVVLIVTVLFTRNGFSGMFDDARAWIVRSIRA
jgi:branched-chain amino acid transport system permease protein